MDIESQRAQFGGFNWVAAFFGWLVASAVTLLITGIVAAIGGGLAFAITQASLRSIGLGSAIGLLIALAVGYYAGGYVAGRMSRFDGGRQGLGVWVFSIIITLVFSLLGALLGTSFNLLQRFSMPSVPVNLSALTIAGLVTLLIGLVVSLLAAMAGAKTGERYHRRVDEAGFTKASAEPEPRQRPAHRPAESFGETVDQRDRED